MQIKRHTGRQAYGQLFSQAGRHTAKETKIYIGRQVSR